MSYENSFQGINKLLELVMEPSNQSVQSAGDYCNEITNTSTGSDHQICNPIDTTSSSEKTEEEPTQQETSCGLRHIDTITGHYYKNQVVRFRCSHKDYNLTSILGIEELSNSPDILKAYLSNLRTKALNTMIRRHNELLVYLRKE